MQQFDICRLRPAPGPRKSTDLVVILQANLNSDLETRVVAPLVGLDAFPPIGRLRPAIEHDGRSYRMIADRLSVLAVKNIGARVGSCEDREYDIRRALDIVFMGE